jgi:hypothetical protein
MRSLDPGDEYIKQRDLLNGLLDMHAQMVERAQADHEAFKRLMRLAEWLEKQLRKNGNTDMPNIAGEIAITAD